MADAEEFTRFVHAQSRGLLRTAWLLTGSWHSAEDLVQSALAKTWLRWDRIQGVDAPGPYVRQVMVRTFLGWRARRWTGETPMRELPETVTSDAGLTLMDARAALVQAIGALPARQRAVIVMRFFDDLTEPATAAALGCSVGTVKSHTARALAALRRTPALRDDVNGELTI